MERNKSTNRKCNRSCNEFCRWIEALPHHKRYVLTKELHPSLPECFEETIFGEIIPGAIRQLRGPYGAHVHEFEDRFELHRDYVNADIDPLGHLVQDAPEYLASIIVALTAGLASSRSRGRGKALLAGGATGIVAFLAGKAIKMLDEGSASEDAKAPRII
jgi:hypothetical protein